MKRVVMLFCVVIAFALVAIVPAQAGKIVLTNDEWTLTNDGFAQAGTQPGQFALNVANWFTGSSGRFLVYSNNFGLTQSSLSAVMTGAGYTWTINSSPVENPDLLYLQSFDGVFLAGNIINNSTLIDYVNNGGNVFLEGGTGSVDDHNAWTTFLNAFDLGYGANYNGIIGNMPISSSHPIFNNVTSLYQNNGNDTLDITAGGNSEVLVSYNGHGLYAVYNGVSNAVPEPATLLLLGLGLLGLAGVKRKS